jgi:transposase InsO family protein
MLALIRAIHAELKGAYGSPRMVKEIRGRGFPASKERVERLMRENNIRSRLGGHASRRMRQLTSNYKQERTP